MQVDRRRADVDKLVSQVFVDARQKNKRIDRIDPIVKCAKRLFPYMREEAIHDVSRIALRIILSEQDVQAFFDKHQTTLTLHMAC